MTKKEEPRKYAENRQELFREFHRVIAPVVVLKVDGKEEEMQEMEVPKVQGEEV